MARVGIFAGTFDPVHNGHIMFARVAAQQCGLDKVVFLPERSPRGKKNTSDLAHRVSMLQLATMSEPALEVVELDEAQFTVAHTLPKLTGMFPGVQLILLVGSDTASTITAWPGWAELTATVEIAVGARDGADLHGLRTALHAARLTFINHPHPAISATIVRKGHLQHVVPAVQDYIAQNRLYFA